MGTRTLSAALAATACMISLNACVGTKLLTPDSRIARETAGILGVSPEQVTITDRRGAGTNTYYVAHVGRRKWGCVINGGNLMTIGMVNPPSCTPANVDGSVPTPAARPFGQ